MALAKPQQRPLNGVDAERQRQKLAVEQVIGRGIPHDDVQVLAVVEAAGEVEAVVG